MMMLILSTASKEKKDRKRENRGNKDKELGRGGG